MTDLGQWMINIVEIARDNLNYNVAQDYVAQVNASDDVRGERYYQSLKTMEEITRKREIRNKK